MEPAVRGVYHLPVLPALPEALREVGVAPG